MEIIIVNTAETGDVFIATDLDSMEVYSCIENAIAEWREDSDVEINEELILAELKKRFRGSGRISKLMKFSGTILNF
jgi:hypothetical protein